MNKFTLAWQKKDPYDNTCYVVEGDRASIFNLWFLLSNDADHRRVTVRDSLGNKLDMNSISMLDMPIYQNGCFL